MYRGISYISHEQKMRLFTWDEDGNRIHIDLDYNPYFYYETANRDKQVATSLYGTKLKKLVCKNEKERRNKLKDLNIERIFENIAPQQQFLLDRFWKVNETEEFNKFPLKNWFFDIEVFSPDEFPKPEDAKYPINIITVYDTINKEFYSWGLGEYKPNLDNVIYVNCKTEKDLLWNFLEFYRKDPPDILSGWNSDTFDIPYIINRLQNLFGEDVSNMISPMNEILFRPVYAQLFRGQFGHEMLKYKVEGISMLDYLDIYKTFCGGQRESYKLDVIGEYEGVGRKVDTKNTNLAVLASTDWETFVDYNIQDVALLSKLDEKLEYLELVRMLSYVGLTPFQGALSTISTVNGQAIIQARKSSNPKVIPTFIKDSHREEKYEGAYVGEPTHNFQRNIVSFDANSLYPSVMLSLNLSPETKFGEILYTDKDFIYIRSVNNKDYKFTRQNYVKWLIKNKICVSKANKLFLQSEKGIFPAVTENFYAKRKQKKREWSDYRNELTKVNDEIARLEQNDNKSSKLSELYRQKSDLELKVKKAWTWQLTLKILINRIYGYFGNKHAQMGDGDIARSITLTGQAVIKESNKIIRDFIKQNTNLTDEQLEGSYNPILYNDTDSVYCTITQLLENRGLELTREIDRPSTNNIEVNPEVYKLVQDIEDYLNERIEKWAVNNLNSTDPRFVFKRESICDKGLFLQKKRYVLHKLDDEGEPCYSFKYTGVEVVRTTMPGPIKPHVKKIIEHMITSENVKSTNDLLSEVYEIFTKLPIEDIAFTMGISDYEKYSMKSDKFNIAKGTPIHVKSAIFYNELLKEYNIDGVYESIGSGDKIRYFYVQQPNKYGCTSLGFKTVLPEEFKNEFKIDYEKMFDKIVYQVIERFYNCVKWRPFKPSKQYETNLFDFFNIE